MSNHRACRRRFSVLMIAGAFLLFPYKSGVNAQVAAPALATATSIRCTFSLMAVGTLRADLPKAEVKPVTFTLQFEAINADEGTAQLKSTFGGKYDIIVRYTKGYLHFVQQFLDGPLYATTVLDKKTSGGKLKAMHSRHEYTDVALPGFTSSPEQYYGECEILK